MMIKQEPLPYGNRLELKLDKIPAKASDRMSSLFFTIGCFLGVILVLLGAYDLGNYSQNGHSDLASGLPDAQYESILNLKFFDVTLILIGLGIIFSFFEKFLTYRKVLFDGKNIECVTRFWNGKKSIIKEKISNYTGVRFRIEFVQSGLITRNKYIVELEHDNAQKNIPLYVSCKSKNIRQIWKKYAKAFNLPAVIMTDEGLSVRKVMNLDKSVRELTKIGALKFNFDPDPSQIPDNIAVVWRSDKIVMKIRKLFWDAYNILALCLISFSFVLFVAWHLCGYTSWKGYALVSLIALLSLTVLLRKDKIVIKKYKIVKVHKFYSFSKKSGEIPKQQIEAVEVTLNPATGRSFVSIISDNKTLIFGKKLPLEDLRWIRNFLLYELTK